MSNDSKGLRPIKDFCPSSQSGTSRKKIVSTKKVYEIDHTETCLWISSISFILNFNKTSKYFYVVGVATSQNSIKKMFSGGGR